MPRLCLFACAVSLSAVSPALAQDTASHVFKTGRELLYTPQKYVGESITVTDGFCVYDEPNVVCFGNETPFEVKATSVLEVRTLARLKDKCGDDLPGKEHDPTPLCNYSFSFVPTRVKIGTGDYVLHDLVQSKKRLVLFETNILDARR